jgi:hypothetical protein
MLPIAWDQLSNTLLL